MRRVDYVAIAAAARRALGDDEAGTELTIHQGEQLRHLLVDEFQDTSLDQFELLEALTRDWEPGDGRSLFLVGDPMQSIYQFREAEVGLFLRARDSGIGRIALEPLALTRNFRSDGEIVGFVNRTFAAIFPARDDPREAAVRYLPCAAASAREPALAPRVRLRHMAPFDERAESRGGRCRSCAACVPEAPGAVRSPCWWRHARMRRRSPRALRGDGIAVQGVDLIPLGEVPAVQDLMSLTRALLDPTDRTAWLGGAAGSVVRADARAISRRCCEARRWRRSRSCWPTNAAPSDLPAEALRAPRASASTCIESARGQLGRAPLAAVVERAWLDLGGAVAYAEASTSLDARRFLDAFAEREQSGEWEGACDLAPLVARLYAPSDTAAGDAVQVMTIHRAKGLEFDAVILPSLGRARRRGEEPLLSYVEWPETADGAAAAAGADPRAPRRTIHRRSARWIRALQSVAASASGCGCCMSRRRARAPRCYLLGALDRQRARETAGAAQRLTARAVCGLRSAWHSRASPRRAARSEPSIRGARRARLLRVAAPWRRPELTATVGGGGVRPAVDASAELPETREMLLRAGLR